MKVLKINSFAFVVSFLTIVNQFVLATNYNIADIPDSLKQNAFAVVRNYNMVFVQSDINAATFKVSTTITILNKQGESHANFTMYGSKFKELSDFSGTIRDASGTIVKKIKKSDLFTSSIDMGALATDNFTMNYRCDYPSYPYTIEYTYQEKWKNGIISYPFFFPVDAYHLSVENASLRMELPANIVLRQQAQNLDITIDRQIVNNKNVFTANVRNLKAMNREPLAPPAYDIFPYVRFAPNDFCYDSSCGKIGSWKDYGLWVFRLLDGRDILPVELSVKMNEITKDAKTAKEKVQVIYEYLQNNTRYVSVQLGIGGFQPIAASAVAKTGFGDCKGLSNLMKAMLKTVDIESYYCEIKSDEFNKNLNRNFSSIEQTNHAILLVPLQNDSIWLECTSQTMPFGYIHEDIAGHDVLVINSQGGKICKLPSYADKSNNRTVKMVFKIDENGNAAGELNIKQYLAESERMSYLIRANDRHKLIKYINEIILLPQMQVGEIVKNENRSALPYTNLNTKFEALDLVNKTGNRFFMSICPVDKSRFNTFTSSSRSLDIDIPNGFSQTDSITFVIPKQFNVENLPKDTNLKTPYGSISSTVSLKDNMITYVQYVEVNSGRYSKESYKEFKDFFAQIVAASKRKLVLVKES